MLKQKEYDALMEDFERNDMQGYQEWFEQNANCKVRDLTSNEPKWLRGIRLQSNAKDYAVIAIEGPKAFRVRFNDFEMI